MKNIFPRCFVFEDLLVKICCFREILLGFESLVHELVSSFYLNFLNQSIVICHNVAVVLLLCSLLVSLHKHIHSFELLFQ